MKLTKVVDYSVCYDVKVEEVYFLISCFLLLDHLQHQKNM